MTAAMIEPTPANEPELALTVTVPHGALTAALRTVGIGADKRLAVPVLGGVMITTGPEGAHLTTYDYWTAVTVRVGPPSTTVGRVLVSYRLLAEVVRAIGRPTPAKVRDLPVTITTDAGKVRVVADGYTFTLPTMPAEDYPPTEDLFVVDIEDHFTALDRDRFAAAVRQIAATAGTDATLPMLTGIRIEAAKGRGLTLAATDRFRLGVATVAAATDADWAELVPAQPLARVIDRLPSDPLMITITNAYGKRYAHITAGPITAAIKILDVEFVKYRSLIPNASDTRFTIDRGALVALCERLAVFAGYHCPVTFNVTENTLTARSGGPHDGSGVSPALRVLHADGSVPISAIAFNPTFVLDGLRAFTGDTIAVGITTPARPMMIAESIDALTDPAAGFRYLVMPARLPNR